MEIPRVEGAVDIERLGIDFVNGAPTIHYDEVPLWYTSVPIEQVDIFLYDGTEEGEPFSLFCRDGFGDIYTYGMWKTKKEALEWLKNPTRLY